MNFQTSGYTNHFCSALVLGALIGLIMDHKIEFESRAGGEAVQVDLFLFGWVDGDGNSGDYGLIDGAPLKTFSTLINTTYMFQPEPTFTLQCRPFHMSVAQFDYLQDHDLDTQEFLSSISTLPEVLYALDLKKHSDAASALLAIENICSN
jgi:hypothetical protein